MTHAAAWIAVDLVDQFGNRVFAVADHVPRHSFRGSDQLAVDDEDSMIEAADKTFDQYRAAMLARFLKSCVHLVRRFQIDGNAAAMVCVQRLEYDRVADALGGAARLPRIVNE